MLRQASEITEFKLIFPHLHLNYMKCYRKCVVLENINTPHKEGTFVLDPPPIQGVLVIPPPPPTPGIFLTLIDHCKSPSRTG